MKDHVGQIKNGQRYDARSPSSATSGSRPRAEAHSTTKLVTVSLLPTIVDQ